MLVQNLENHLTSLTIAVWTHTLKDEPHLFTTVAGTVLTSMEKWEKWAHLWEMQKNCCIVDCPVSLLLPEVFTKSL